MTFIAIDPSIASVGWCVAGKDGYLASGIIKTDATASDADRLTVIAKAFIGLAFEYSIEGCYIEIPDSFSFARSKSAKGVGLNQASLHKLNRAIGAVMVVWSLYNLPVYEVKVSAWKGKRNKKLDQIIARQLSGKKCGPDEADAICLAEYCRGRRGNGKS